MKLLIISWYFPPANTIAAVRLGNLVRFLSSRGHEVKVLAGKDLPYPRTLNLDLSGCEVHGVAGFDINSPPRIAVRIIKGALRSLAGLWRSRPVPSDGQAGGEASEATDSKGPGKLGAFYMNAVNIPDSRIGWLPGAVLQGRRILAGWRPDFIFSSAPPFTVLLVGHLLAKLFKLPHVVEFRDRWFDDPYFAPPPWRMKIDKWLEMKILARATAITTVSEPWAETYRQRHGKPVAVVYNGHDKALVDVEPAGSPDREILRIVYTGGIYPGFRDPSGLFAALDLMGDRAKQIKVDFLGTEPATLQREIDRFGAAASVTVLPPVTHKEALKIQRQADVLYLLQWNDPKEQGNVPGKFFEYLGARRPILLSGYEDGVPASIIRERKAGFFSNDPEQISQQLNVWLDQKKQHGRIDALPEEACRGFTRDEQYLALENFLSQLTGQT